MERYDNSRRKQLIWFSLGSFGSLDRGEVPWLLFYYHGRMYVLQWEKAHNGKRGMNDTIFDTWIDCSIYEFDKMYHFRMVLICLAQ